MDKILSWKDLGSTITKMSGDPDNRCPSYNRVKQANSNNAINKIIYWPKKRQKTQLITNAQLITIFSYYMKIQNIDMSISKLELLKGEETIISIRALQLSALQITPVSLHYKIIINGQTIYDNAGHILDNNIIKCYEEGYDDNIVTPEIHQFKIISKAHFRSGSIEIWIYGQEKTKKMIELIDPYVE